MKPYLPKSFEEQLVSAIHDCSCASYNLEELYQTVETMCSDKMAGKLMNVKSVAFFVHDDTFRAFEHLHGTKHNIQNVITMIIIA